MPIRKVSLMTSDLALGQAWRALQTSINEALAAVAQSSVSSIVWKPGVPSSGTQVATWAEVMAEIAANKGQVEVSIDPSVAPCDVPPGSYDLEGRVTFTPLLANINPPGTSVNITAGATLRNLAGANGPMAVVGINNAMPSLVFDIAGSKVFGLRNGAVLANAGAFPMIQVVAGDLVALGLDYNSGFVPSPSPVVDVAAGGMFVVNAMNRSLFFAGWITGVVGSSLLYQVDDTMDDQAGGTFPPIPGFLGNVTINYLAKASVEYYDDALALPSTGSVTVQQICDWLKQNVSGPPLYASIIPTLGGKPATQEISPAGHLWVVNFGSAGTPNKPYGIECYDITTNPAAPLRISYTGTPTFGWYNVYAIRFRGTTMFATANGPLPRTIRSVDVSNPATPANISSVALDGDAYDMALSLDGNTAVVAQVAGSGLRVVDVTNPAAMAVLASVAGTFTGVDTSLWPNVLVCNNLVGALQVYDMTNLAVPVLVGALALSANVRRVTVDTTTNVAYVGTSSGTTNAQMIYVVDLSNLAAPALLTSIPCSMAGDDTPMRLATIGGRRLLFCPGGAQTTSPSRLTTFDVSSPSAPTFLHAVDLGQNVYDCTPGPVYTYVSNRGGPQELFTVRTRALSL